MADDERLDKALSNYLIGKHPKQADLDPLASTLDRLEILREIPERDADIHVKGRQIFLQQARTMLIPVSKEPKQRLKGWNKFFRKERLPMTTVVSAILALILTLGGVGATAYAAQGSLPTEPLYPVKQFTEHIRLSLTTDPEAEVSLLLDLAEERLSEMVSLANKGSAIPGEVQLRLEQHLQLALSEAAQLGDSAMQGILEQLRNMAQNQIQILQQTQQNAPEEITKGLELAIRAMNSVQKAAEDGLTDPTTFRLRQGMNRPEDAPPQPEIVPPGKGNENQTPSNDLNSEGPGDGTGEGGDAWGNGPGDGTGDGGDAWGDGHGDGSGDGGGAYGDGKGDGTPCDSTDCTPQAPQNGPQGTKGGGREN